MRTYNSIIHSYRWSRKATELLGAQQSFASEVYNDVLINEMRKPDRSIQDKRETQPLPCGSTVRAGRTTRGK